MDATQVCDPISSSLRKSSYKLPDLLTALTTYQTRLTELKAFIAHAFLTQTNTRKVSWPCIVLAHLPSSIQEIYIQTSVIEMECTLEEQKIQHWDRIDWVGINEALDLSRFPLLQRVAVVFEIDGVDSNALRDWVYVRFPSCCYSKRESYRSCCRSRIRENLSIECRQWHILSHSLTTERAVVQYSNRTVLTSYQSTNHFWAAASRCSTFTVSRSWLLYLWFEWLWDRYVTMWCTVLAACFWCFDLHLIIFWSFSLPRSFSATFL